jgi:WD40 repeat protein/serine/threonine protein kinase
MAHDAVICPVCRVRVNLPAKAPPGTMFRCPKCSSLLPPASASAISRRSTEEILVEIRQRMQGGEQVRIEEYLAVQPEIAANTESLLDLVYNEILLRQQHGERPTLAEYQQRFPALAEELRVQFEVDALMFSEAAGATESFGEKEDTTKFRSPTLKGGGPRIQGYEMMELLGRGGMGAVYKARQTSLNRLVAIKTLRSGAHASEGELARFRTEAEVIARFQHPHLVQIFEVGAEDDCLFLALEYVEGGTLARLLDGTPWEAKRAARLIETLANAIDYAHRQGVVHRDLKPANILLKVAPASKSEIGSTQQPASTSPPASSEATLAFSPSAGESEPSSQAVEMIPKITDFGLAKDVLSQEGHTESGAFMGTPSYAAPEQASGDSRNATTRTDVYALGAILYELTTGRPPFRGVNAIETLDQIRHQEPVAPRLLNPSLPRDLETICLKCLNKVPTARYGSAAELGEDLARFVRQEPVLARPVGTLERGWRWCRRNRGIATFMALFVLTLVVGTTVSAIFGILANINAAELERTVKEEQKQRKLAKLAADDAEAKKLLADEKTKETQKALQEAQEATQRADAELERARASAFTTQMLRAGAMWEREPVLVRSLLDDTEICPPSRRDLTWKLLDRLCRPEKASAKFKNAQDLSKLAVSDNGLVIASRSESPFVWILDRKTSRNFLANTQIPADHAALARDGKLLALATANKIHLLNPVTMAISTTLEVPEGRIGCLAFSSDGNTLAAGVGRSVSLWDVKTRMRRQTLENYDNIVRFARFGKDDMALAILTQSPADKYKSSLALHDLTKNTVLQLLADKQFHDVAFGPDGQTLAAAAEHDILVWDSPGSPSRLLWKGLTHAMTFSPDGQTIAAAGEDRAVNLIDAKTGKSRMVLRGHPEFIIGVAYANDGSLISGSRDGTVRVWNATVPGPQILEGQPERVVAAAFSGNGRIVASLGSISTKLWDLQTNQVRLSIPRISRPTLPLGIRFAANDRVLYSFDEAGRFYSLDAESGGILGPALEGANYSLATSPDGKRFATVRGGSVVLWDAATRTELPMANADKRFNYGLAFSPDSALLAGSDDAGTIHVWEVANGKRHASFAENRDQIRALAFSLDGKTLASGGRDRTIRLWDVAQRKLLATLEGHTNYVTRLAFGGDGTSLISSADDGIIKVWNLPTRQERFSLFSHQGIFDLSRDGFRLVTTEKNGTVKVWHASDLPLPDKEVVQAKVAAPSSPSEIKGAMLMNVVHDLSDSEPFDRVRADSYCRVYKLELKADVTYQMTMQSIAMDSYLRLEDASRKEVANDDDGGGNRDARLTFVPTNPGTYYLIATTYKRGSGRFALTVREGGIDDKLLQARASLRARQWEQATELFDQVLLTAPSMRGQVIHEVASAGAVEILPKLYRRLINRRPNDLGLRLESARCAAENGYWAFAASDYAHQMRLAPTMPDPYFEHACVLLLVNDVTGFKQLSPGALERAKDGKMRSYQTARIFTLMPHSEEERKQAERLSEQELAKMGNRHAALTVLGAQNVRAGRHAEAQQTLKQCLETYPNWEGSVLPRLWLALAAHGQGNADEARKELALATATMDQWGSRMPKSASRPGFIPLHLHDWLEAQVLRREAEKVLAK